MGRRTLLLIAAVAIAAVGTTMVFLYVNGVNDRALADQQPVAVLVAKAQINAGTSVEDASAAAAFELKRISKQSVVPGAVSDLTPLTGRVALSTIFPGEQIIADRFGESGASSRLPVPDNKLAISVQLDDPARVAGFISPGSVVAIFLNITDRGSEQTRLLLPKVEVIATGDTTLVSDAASTGNTGSSGSSGSGSSGAAETQPKALLTLAVDQQQYQKVFFASMHGQMHLALIGKDAQLSTGVAGTDAQNLFN